MSHYAKINTVRGTPEKLARWAYRSLSRRVSGRVYLLVLEPPNKAVLVARDSDRAMEIEEWRPQDVVGPYTGFRKEVPTLTVDDFEADIRMTLEGV